MVTSASTIFLDFISHGIRHFVLAYESEVTIADKNFLPFRSELYIFFYQQRGTSFSGTINYVIRTIRSCLLEWKRIATRKSTPTSQLSDWELSFGVGSEPEMLP